jgi:hypothetical protein
MEGWHVMIQSTQNDYPGAGEVRVVCTCGKSNRRARKIEFFELFNGVWYGENCGPVTAGGPLGDAMLGDRSSEDRLSHRGDSRFFQRRAELPVWRARCRTCAGSGDPRHKVELPGNGLLTVLRSLSTLHDRLDLYELTHHPDTFAAKLRSVGGLV